MWKSIAFFGRFNSGKSTLINSIFGKKVVPERSIPTHVPPVCISYGNKNEVVLQYKEGKRVSIHDFDWIEIEKRCADREVEILSVKLNHIYLKGGIEVWDTPGIDDIDSSYTDFAIKFFNTHNQRIEKVFYLISASALTRTDIDCIKSIRAKNSNITVLVSKSDKNTSEEIQKILVESEKILRQALGSAITVQAVSSRSIWANAISNVFIHEFDLNYVLAEYEKLTDESMKISMELQGFKTHVDSMKSLFSSSEKNLKSEFALMSRDNNEKYNGVISSITNCKQQLSNYLTDLSKEHQNLSSKVDSAKQSVINDVTSQSARIIEKASSNYTKLNNEIDSVQYNINRFANILSQNDELIEEKIRQLSNDGLARFKISAALNIIIIEGIIVIVLKLFGVMA